MADRQTTGGYPTIANVITADLPLAGQLAPGDWIAFAPCTRDDAIAALSAARSGAARSSARERHRRSRCARRLGAGARAARRAARAVHDLQGRRPADWLVQARTRATRSWPR